MHSGDEKFVRFLDERAIVGVEIGAARNYYYAG
jgi:hypothetical protein